MWVNALHQFWHWQEFPKYLCDNVIKVLAIHDLLYVFLEFSAWPSCSPPWQIPISTVHTATIMQNSMRFALSCSTTNRGPLLQASVQVFRSDRSFRGPALRDGMFFETEILACHMHLLGCQKGINTVLLLLLLLLLLLFKKIGISMPGEWDWHPMNPKTPAPHYQPIEEKKWKGK